MAEGTKEEQIDWGKAFAVIKRLSGFVARTKVTLEESLDGFLAAALDYAREVTHVDGCAVFLLDDDDRLMVEAYRDLPSDIWDNLDPIELGDGVTGEAAASRETRFSNDLPNDPKRKFPKTDKYAKSMRAIPAMFEGVLYGTVNFYRAKKSDFGGGASEFLEEIGTRVGAAIGSARKNEIVRNHNIQRLYEIVKSVEAESPYHKGHLDRVTAYVIETGEDKELGLSRVQKRNLRNASRIHDAGKIELVDCHTILISKKRLSDEQWTEMRKHPDKGVRYARKEVPGIEEEVLLAIKYHHVHYGGGGYPECGLKGEEIPLLARILAVADSYDAMTSDRPYKMTMPGEVAVEELKKYSGYEDYDRKLLSTYRALEKMWEEREALRDFIAFKGETAEDVYRVAEHDSIKQVIHEYLAEDKGPEELQFDKKVVKAFIAKDPVKIMLRLRNAAARES